MIAKNKNHTVTVGDLPDSTPPGTPAWLKSLRDAAAEVVTPDAMQEMVQAQVDRAKGGDAKAMEFVLDKVLGAAAMRGTTIVQNVTHNHFEGAADRDEVAENLRIDRENTDPKSRVKLMEARLAAGLPLCDDEADGRVDLS